MDSKCRMERKTEWIPWLLAVCFLLNIIPATTGLQYTPVALQGSGDGECALVLNGPGRSSSFDYSLNLLRGGGNGFGYNGPHTCITYDAVNAAYLEARKRVQVAQPHGDYKPEDVATVGELLLDISVNLARTYGLSYEDIEKGLPLIDTSKTLIREICPPFLSNVECRPGKYRRFDGLCTNLENPTWGSTMQPFTRLIGPLYADGMTAPRISVTGNQLPLARVVSRTMHPDEGFHDHAGTVMVIAWGQFIDHDYTLTATPLDPLNRNDPEECCKRPPHLKNPYCNEIHIPEDDYFYRLFNVRCMDFVRGFPAARPGCRLGSRSQYNLLTGVLDANTVYGVSEKFSRKLRSGYGGQLRMNPVFREYGLKDLLPLKLDIPDEGCTRPNRSMYCFEAGEIRVNEQLVLTCMHTLMAREHNRIAEGLQQVNPHWDDETTFQEARRLTIAVVQHITYNEFLPILLGKEVMEKFGLLLNKDGYWDGHDQSVNPNVIDAFAAAAYRFGHSLLPTAVERWSKAHKFIASKRLSDLIRRPYDLYRAGVIDEYFMGLMNQVAQAMDDSITQEVTNHLFKKVGARYGMDLVSFNMQRGREFGLPGYMEFRKFCGLPGADSFDELFGSMPNETIKRYSTIFEHPHDVDLWSGGVSERPLPGSMLGPTFACIIATQFSYSRRGDRFWYELPHQPSSFSPEQLKEIRKARLARVICDNTDLIDSIQLYPMVLPDHEINPRVPCRSGVLPSMDFSKWADHGSHNFQQHQPFSNNLVDSTALHPKLLNLANKIISKKFSQSNLYGKHPYASLFKTQVPLKTVKILPVIVLKPAPSIKEIITITRNKRNVNNETNKDKSNKNVTDEKASNVSNQKLSKLKEFATVSPIVDQVTQAITVTEVSGSPADINDNVPRNFQPFLITSSDFKNNTSQNFEIQDFVDVGKLIQEKLEKISNPSFDNFESKEEENEEKNKEDVENKEEEDNLDKLETIDNLEEGKVIDVGNLIQQKIKAVNNPSFKNFEDINDESNEEIYKEDGDNEEDNLENFEEDKIIGKPNQQKLEKTSTPNFNFDDVKKQMNEEIYKEDVESEEEEPIINLDNLDEIKVIDYGQILQRKLEEIRNPNLNKFEDIQEKNNEEKYKEDTYNEEDSLDNLDNLEEGKIIDVGKLIQTKLKAVTNPNFQNFEDIKEEATEEKYKKEIKNEKEEDNLDKLDKFDLLREGKLIDVDRKFETIINPNFKNFEDIKDEATEEKYKKDVVNEEKEDNLDTLDKLDILNEGKAADVSKLIQQKLKKMTIPDFSKFEGIKEEEKEEKQNKEELENIYVGVGEENSEGQKAENLERIVNKNKNQEKEHRQNIEDYEIEIEEPIKENEEQEQEEQPLEDEKGALLIHVPEYVNKPQKFDENAMTTLEEIEKETNQKYTNEEPLIIQEENIQEESPDIPNSFAKHFIEMGAMKQPKQMIYETRDEEENQKQKGNLQINGEKFYIPFQNEDSVEENEEVKEKNKYLDDIINKQFDQNEKLRQELEYPDLDNEYEKYRESAENGYLEDKSSDFTEVEKPYIINLDGIFPYEEHNQNVGQNQNEKQHQNEEPNKNIEQNEDEEEEHNYKDDVDVGTDKERVQDNEEYEEEEETRNQENIEDDKEEYQEEEIQEEEEEEENEKVSSQKKYIVIPNNKDSHAAKNKRKNRDNSKQINNVNKEEMAAYILGRKYARSIFEDELKLRNKNDENLKQIYDANAEQIQNNEEKINKYISGRKQTEKSYEDKLRNRNKENLKQIYNINKEETTPYISKRENVGNIFEDMHNIKNKNVENMEQFYGTEQIKRYVSREQKIEKKDKGKNRNEENMEQIYGTNTEQIKRFAPKKLKKINGNGEKLPRNIKAQEHEDTIEAKYIQGKKQEQKIYEGKMNHKNKEELEKNIRNTRKITGNVEDKQKEEIIESTTENIADSLNKILNKKDAISRHEEIDKPKEYNTYWTLEYKMPPK